MKNINIKDYIKARGYTVAGVARILNYSLPTLDKLIKKKPNAIYYAVKGLPELTHTRGERKKTIRTQMGYEL